MTIVIDASDTLVDIWSVLINISLNEVKNKNLNVPKNITGKYYPFQIFKLTDEETNIIWKNFYNLKLTTFHFYNESKSVINKLSKENKIVIMTGKNNKKYYRFEKR